ncbi:trypsin-like cysteine/serine peptidase domain-containing protein [Penicillium waksmanii]|uniref:trypsin-like cysteine/serine peptidase domain-containing protein n=1 Tax=Penicillium waksmanii TaxID=69791 RepID=UPI0025495324|nr:trypsin-like cysteine/serine peptidase domain-containing protein [Penicillium waksmanii]KAJ6001142.1 trypsin-like cysteine/serine peptidase domain-containing protein [Penicillium waksmanii]
MKPAKTLTNCLCLISFILHSASAIVGGNDASAASAPFAVAIISSGWFGDSYHCAGSLIGPKSVLTTAGCVDGFSATSLKARIGSLEHAAGGQLQQVTKIIKHPNYNTNTHDHDYAVLHLTYPITNIEFVAISEQAPVTGEPQLQTTFMSFSECDQIWSDVNTVTSNMNCDAAPEKSQGSCSHDQGGPVVNDSGELVGIIGYYNYCAPQSDGRPDVNNDPVGASDWIAQNTI